MAKRKYPSLKITLDQFFEHVDDEEMEEFLVEELKKWNPFIRLTLYESESLELMLGEKPDKIFPFFDEDKPALRFSISDQIVEAAERGPVTPAIHNEAYFARKTLRAIRNACDEAEKIYDERQAIAERTGFPDMTDEEKAEIDSYTDY